VHNIRTASESNASVKSHSRLSLAPAVSLPPFLGIGKRPALPATAANTGKTPRHEPVSGCCCARHTTCLTNPNGRGYVFE
jgi:hypothetical protein